jgi:hypothetical protein
VRPSHVHFLAVMGETYANSQPRPPVHALAYRTHRFAILAMSLSSLFDISHPSDFLRSALNMLTEYEQAKEDNDRPKIVWLPTLTFFAWSLIAVIPPMFSLASLEMATKTANRDG